MCTEYVPVGALTQFHLHFQGSLTQPYAFMLPPFS